MTTPSDSTPTSDGLIWIEFRATGNLYTHNGIVNEWGVLVLDPISAKQDKILVSAGELANLKAVGAVKEIGWS